MGNSDDYKMLKRIEESTPCNMGNSMRVHVAATPDKINSM